MNLIAVCSEALCGYRPLINGFRIQSRLAAEYLLENTYRYANRQKLKTVKQYRKELADAKTARHCVHSFDSNLRKLQEMGIAVEVKPDAWVLANAREEVRAAERCWDAFERLMVNGNNSVAGGTVCWYGVYDGLGVRIYKAAFEGRNGTLSCAVIKAALRKNRVVAEVVHWNLDERLSEEELTAFSGRIHEVIRGGLETEAEAPA